MTRASRPSKSRCSRTLGGLAAVLASASLVAHVSAADTPAEMTERLNQIPDAEQLRLFHDLTAGEPHDAGTPGDQNVIQNLIDLFESFGLEVERQDIWVYLSKPISSRVEILADDGTIELATREPSMPEDTFSSRPDLRGGWNAYSASGDVAGEVVYANYGRQEDFEKLAELGVEVEGKIVLARYGGNFRGYKAKFAQQAGAIGLIMYTDPANDGYGRGIPYPEGGFANGGSIQRGSILTLPYIGDPLTPFDPATEDADRLDPSDVGFPEIPVQPIGWDAAKKIHERMTGDAVPGGWQGGLPLAYRLTGGPDLLVRVQVEQERGLVKTANVIGRVRGSEDDLREVIVGCHHDAWGYGASDPTAGLICLLESARSFGELAAQGILPRRTVAFAAWGAEEYGIIGSAEYVESRPNDLIADAVAYLNLDMAAMGPDFRASASPSLRPAIEQAARRVRAITPGANGEPQTVYEQWDARTAPPGVTFGNLGGGSDHVGFLCHTCVASAAIGAGGSRGVAYHTMYDSLDWYRTVVGNDYLPAVMVTHMANSIIAELVHASTLPHSPGAFGSDIIGHLQWLSRRAHDLGLVNAPGENGLAFEFERIRIAAMELTHAWEHANELLTAADGLDPIDRGRIDDLLLEIDRAWCAPRFDTGREWFKNGYAATDPTSGYSAWMLPALRNAIESKDPELLMEQRDAYVAVLDTMTSAVRSITRTIENSSRHAD